MIDQNIFNRNLDFIGVKGMVFIDGKIIVIRRDNNTKIFPLRIDLPGGGREKGESPFETFKRELKEELSIDINEEDILFAYLYGDETYKEHLAYFMVTKNLNIKKEYVVLGNEGLEFKFISPEEFIDLDDSIIHLQSEVKKYLNSIKK
ncbi:MAG: NUDIX domain-containing protein [Candidatus Nomurabacteria bacterium]